MLIFSTSRPWQHLRVRWFVVIVLVVIALLIASIGNLLAATGERSDVLEQREDAFLVARSFQRLQREVLNLLVLTAGSSTTLNLDSWQLQRNITASRFFDLNTGLTYNRLTPELRLVLENAEALWDSLQPNLDAYQESGFGEADLRAELAGQLKELELAVNDADNVHVIKIDNLDYLLAEAEERVLEAEILLVGLLVLAIICIALTIILQLWRSAWQVRQANEALQVAHQHLQERTVELDQKNQALEEASRLKSEFLATMSHELRTPLNAILGYAGLLKFGIRGETNTEGKEVLTRVEASGKHLLELINNILDLAKIEAGRLEVIYEPVELRSLVTSWSERLRVLAETKGLDFQTQVDDALPQVIQADSERLTQIANNLLSNAIKFTDQGQVLLQAKHANDCWVLQVSDTGSGIPPDAQEYIFDEFRQVDGSYKRVHGGTGLGLSIVRKIVHAMNGSVRVDSKLGQGSTFVVTLPLRSAEGSLEG